MADADWAWPKLIDSLQRDIASLQSTVESMRRESSEAAAEHRREIDGLIDSLRLVRDEIRPITEERQRAIEGRDKVKWAWIERLLWAGTGVFALAAWEFIKRKLGLPT